MCEVFSSPWTCDTLAPTTARIVIPQSVSEYTYYTTLCETPETTKTPQGRKAPGGFVVCVR